MLFIVISMVVIVAVAGMVVAFVALPGRSESDPTDALWLGDDGAADPAHPAHEEQPDHR